MRKRIIIGLLAVVVIGVLLLVQTGERSAEHHIKEYVQVYYGRGWTERLRDRWSKITGRPVDEEARNRRAYKQMSAHERALVRLGYLEERRFKITGDPRMVMIRAADAWYGPGLRFDRAMYGFNTNVICFAGGSTWSVKFQIAPTNELVVIAQPKEMRAWEEFVRKADLEVTRRPDVLR